MDPDSTAIASDSYSFNPFSSDRRAQGALFNNGDDIFKVLFQDFGEDNSAACVAQSSDIDIPDLQVQDALNSFTDEISQNGDKMNRQADDTSNEGSSNIIEELQNTIAKHKEKINVLKKHVGDYEERLSKKLKDLIHTRTEMNSIRKRFEAAETERIDLKSKVEQLEAQNYQYRELTSQKDIDERNSLDLQRALSLKDKMQQKLKNELEHCNQQIMEKNNHLKKMKKSSKNLWSIINRFAKKLENADLLTTKDRNSLMKRKDEVDSVAEDMSDSEDQGKERIFSSSVSNEKLIPGNELQDGRQVENKTPENGYSLCSVKEVLSKKDGFQFSQSRLPATSSPILKPKPTLGTNYFMKSAKEVIDDPHAREQLDVTFHELSEMRKQLSMHNERVDPISPLPPTPPPNYSRHNHPQKKLTIEDPEFVSAQSNKTHDQTPKMFAGPQLLAIKPPHPTSSRRYKFHHQQSEGFDVPSETSCNRSNSVKDEFQNSQINTSVPTNCQQTPYRFFAKRCYDGNMKFGFNIFNPLDLQVDPNSWDVSCTLKPIKSEGILTNSPVAEPQVELTHSQIGRLAEESLHCFQEEQVTKRKKQLFASPKTAISKLKGVGSKSFVSVERSDDSNILNQDISMNINSLSCPSVKPLIKRDSSFENTEMKKDNNADGSYISLQNDKKCKIENQTDGNHIDDKSVVSSSCESPSPYKKRSDAFSSKLTTPTGKLQAECLQENRRDDEPGHNDSQMHGSFSPLKVNCPAEYDSTGSEIDATDNFKESKFNSSNYVPRKRRKKSIIESVGSSNVVPALEKNIADTDGCHNINTNLRETKTVCVISSDTKTIMSEIHKEKDTQDSLSDSGLFKKPKPRKVCKSKNKQTISSLPELENLKKDDSILLLNGNKSPKRNKSKYLKRGKQAVLDSSSDSPDVEFSDKKSETPKKEEVCNRVMVNEKIIPKASKTAAEIKPTKPKKNRKMNKNKDLPDGHKSTKKMAIKIEKAEREKMAALRKQASEWAVKRMNVDAEEKEGETEMAMEGDFCNTSANSLLEHAQENPPKTVIPKEETEPEDKPSDLVSSEDDKGWDNHFLNTVSVKTDHIPLEKTFETENGYMVHSALEKDAYTDLVADYKNIEVSKVNVMKSETKPTLMVHSTSNIKENETPETEKRQNTIELIQHSDQHNQFDINLPSNHAANDGVKIVSPGKCNTTVKVETALDLNTFLSEMDSDVPSGESNNLASTDTVGFPTPPKSEITSSPIRNESPVPGITFEREKSPKSEITSSPITSESPKNNSPLAKEINSEKIVKNGFLPESLSGCNLPIRSESQSEKKSLQSTQKNIFLGSNDMNKMISQENNEHEVNSNDSNISRLFGTSEVTSQSSSYSPVEGKPQHKDIKNAEDEERLTINTEVPVDVVTIGTCKTDIEASLLQPASSEEDSCRINNPAPKVSSNIKMIVDNVADMEVSEEVEVETHGVPKKIIRNGKTFTINSLDHQNDEETLKSAFKCINMSIAEQSTLLDGSPHHTNGKVSEIDSDGEPTLFIADDTDYNVPSEADLTDECPTGTSTNSAGSNNLKKAPKKKTKKNYLTAKKAQKHIEISPIKAAFQAIEKLKFLNEHSKLNLHSLVNVLINPSYVENTKKLVYHVVEHLYGTRRNPMQPYYSNNDQSLLFPIPEQYIVTALFQINRKNKPHLSGLLTSVANTLYDLVIGKRHFGIYGLSALCRVMAAVCKYLGDKKNLLLLCCDLLKYNHRFAPYLIASIVGVWKEPFEVLPDTTGEEKIFLSALTYGVQYKPKTLTDTQWKHCSYVLSHYLTAEVTDDLDQTVHNIMNIISKKCFKESYKNEFMVTGALIVYARVNGCKWSKLHLVDHYIIPALEVFSGDDANERAFALFADLYVHICFDFPSEMKPRELLEHYFLTDCEMEFVQFVAASALLKIVLLRHECFPKEISKWMGKNSEDPRLQSCAQYFRWRTVANRDIVIDDIIS